MGVVKKMGWYQCTVETLAGHSLCGIRQLPGISARRAGISLDGPHHSPFAWVLHFYAGPPFGPKGPMLLLCLPSALLILTFWLSSLTSGLPHLCGFTKKPLLCSSCFLWGWRYSMPDVLSPWAPIFLKPVTQPVLLLPGVIYKLLSTTFSRDFFLTRCCSGNWSCLLSLKLYRF